MAGYMKKLQGHVYDGSHVAAAEMANGIFATINSSNKAAAVSAKVTGVTLRVDEKTTLWGMPAVVLTVVAAGASDEVYFVENEFEIYEGFGDYNKAEYTVPAGHFVKMHRILAGEQMIVTVDSSLYASLNEGDKVCPTANGTVVAA